VTVTNERRKINCGEGTVIPVLN